jgi:hypothetical protein
MLKLVEKKRKTGNQTKTKSPSTTNEATGRNGAPKRSWNALRHLQEGNNIKDVDIASPQGKVFTRKTSSAEEVREGRPQGGK